MSEMNSTTILAVTTPKGLKLTVRAWRFDDIEDNIKHANNIKIYEALQRLPHPYTRKDAEWWINHCTDVNNFLAKAHPPNTSIQEDTTSNRVAYLPSDYVIALNDKLIGSVGLNPDPNNPQALSFGYWLAEEYWGQGIVSTVAASFLQWTFETFPWIVRIQADAYSWNIASQKILVKAGLVYEGRQKMKVCKDGKWFDLVLFGKVRDGWTPPAY